MELAHVGLILFDRRGAAEGRGQVAAQAGVRAKADMRLFCALCRHPVTHQDQRIAVNGGHEHRCTNPGGYTFDIGCFHEAGGCITTGEATAAHTWFSGYAWRIAICASCDRHLGWRFQAPEHYFHGLILGRLTSIADAGGN